MGGRLVCEFALYRQGEIESDGVNRFPYGQTHVGFANLYFRCLATVTTFPSCVFLYLESSTHDFSGQNRQNLRLV